MSHPLLCWDIVAEGMGRRNEFAKDIVSVHAILHKQQCFFSEAAAINSIVWENKTILITDIDLKIILATKNITGMNGYSQEEVIGKSPRMFQGKETSSTTKKNIRTAIDKLAPFDYTITNYRKDGSLYSCHIEGYPIFNRQGLLINFMALENIA